MDHYHAEALEKGREDLFALFVRMIRGFRFFVRGANWLGFEFDAEQLCRRVGSRLDPRLLAGGLPARLPEFKL